MTKNWQEKRKNDYYYKKAKKEKYRSRSAYKLKQLDEKFGILKKGNVAIDLGAAPGGWLQVAREKIGKEGYLLGIDLVEIKDLNYSNIKLIKEDITDPKIIKKIEKNIPQKPDVILSDASPDITGTWEIDHARSIDLCKNVLKITKKLLKNNGNIILKVFQGKFFKKFLEKTKKEFKYFKSSKPKASRDSSSEIYMIGKNYSPT